MSGAYPSVRATEGPRVQRLRRRSVALPLGDGAEERQRAHLAGVVSGPLGQRSGAAGQPGGLGGPLLPVPGARQPEQGLGLAGGFAQPVPDRLRLGEVLARGTVPIDVHPEIAPREQHLGARDAGRPARRGEHPVHPAEALDRPARVEPPPPEGRGEPPGERGLRPQGPVQRRPEVGGLRFQPRAAADVGVAQGRPVPFRDVEVVQRVPAPDVRDLARGHEPLERVRPERFEHVEAGVDPLRIRRTSALSTRAASASAGCGTASPATTPIASAVAPPANTPNRANSRCAAAGRSA